MCSQPTQPDGSNTFIDNELTELQLAEIEKLGQGLLTMDGQVSGVNAYEGKLSDHYISRDTSILKFASETSSDEQPNNKAYVHSDFKRYYRKLYESDESEDANKYVSPNMLIYLDGALKTAGFDPSSYRTYRRLFANLYACAEECWTEKKLRLGWIMAGCTNPPNWIKMLDQSSPWSSGGISSRSRLISAQVRISR